MTAQQLRLHSSGKKSNLRATKRLLKDLMIFSLIKASNEFNKCKYCDCNVMSVMLSNGGLVLLLDYGNTMTSVSVSGNAPNMNCQHQWHRKEFDIGGWVVWGMGAYLQEKVQCQLEFKQLISKNDCIAKMLGNYCALACKNKLLNDNSKSFYDPPRDLQRRNRWIHPRLIDVID